MSERLIHIEVLSPGGELFSGAVSFAVLPGVQGPFAVFPMHAPIISELREGVIRCVIREGNEKTIGITGGFAEVRDDHITVAAEQ